MGPVPNTNNINAVRPVVMLASRMEDRALLNPSATALRIPFPLRNSSRTRSKINTLASTEIPIVSTIPAIPGKVKTAPNPARTPNISNMLKVKQYRQRFQKFRSKRPSKEVPRLERLKRNKHHFLWLLVPTKDLLFQIE